MARLLLVHGGHAGGRTARLVAAVGEGAREAGREVELNIRPALLADADDLRGAQGLLLGTPEHFGYMSGALKDFFDRTFYPVARNRLIRYAGAWSPTEFQFFFARLRLSDSAFGSKVTGSMCEK